MKSGFTVSKKTAIFSTILSLMTGLFLISGCGAKDDTPAVKGEPDYLVQQGDKVKVGYKGTLDDGTVFDQSGEGDSLAFTVGTGQLIPGFDQGVIGMKVNEMKTVIIPPEEAYGMPNPAMVRAFAKSFFPEDMEIEVGQMMQLQDQMGRPHQVKVTEIMEDSINLDMNHFLAGKTLTFEIRMLAIE
jgi:peptidylprolyl isomerase